MVNEEIITGLRNAVDHGESLQEAVQVMMNSGYNPAEVQEASRYIGGGSLHMQQPMPAEHLMMPEQKSALSKFNIFKKQAPQMQQIPPQIQPPQIQPQVQPQQFVQNQYSAMQTQIKQEISQEPPPQNYPPYQPQVQQSVPLTRQLDRIRPPSPGYAKEIILLIVLLILIGALVATIVFKDTILSWFA